MTAVGEPAKTTNVHDDVSVEGEVEGQTILSGPTTATPHCTTELIPSLSFSRAETVVSHVVRGLSTKPHERALVCNSRRPSQNSRDTVGLSLDALGLNNDNVVLRQDIVGLRQGNVGLNSDTVGLSQDIVGLSKGNVGLNNDVGLSQDIMGLSQGNVGLNQGNVGLSQVKSKPCQVTMGLRQGPIGPHEDITEVIEQLRAIERQTQRDLVVTGMNKSTDNHENDDKMQTTPETSSHYSSELQTSFYEDQYSFAQNDGAATQERASPVSATRQRLRLEYREYLLPSNNSHLPSHLTVNNSHLPSHLTVDTRPSSCLENPASSNTGSDPDGQMKRQSDEDLVSVWVQHTYWQKSLPQPHTDVVCPEYWTVIPALTANLDYLCQGLSEKDDLTFAMQKHAGTVRYFNILRSVQDLYQYGFTFCQNLLYALGPKVHVLLTICVHVY